MKREEATKLGRRLENRLPETSLKDESALSSPVPVTDGLHGGCVLSTGMGERWLLSLQNEAVETRIPMEVGEIDLEPPAEASSQPDEAAPPAYAWEENPEALREICRAIRFHPESVRNDARLVLLELSPRLAHAYWSISEPVLEELRARLGPALEGAVLTLRFYEVAFFNSPDVLHQFDIDVHGYNNNWYMHLWSGGKRYITELGFRMKDGRFERIARSNPIELPRERSVEARAAEYLYAERNTIPAPRPAIPEIFSLVDPQAEATLERMDDPQRDYNADRLVRDVYRRLPSEGPRVLLGRALLYPTPREILFQEYRARREARRKERDREREAPPILLTSRTRAPLALEPRSSQENIVASAAGAVEEPIIAPPHAAPPDSEPAGTLFEETLPAASPASTEAIESCPETFDVMQSTLSEIAGLPGERSALEGVIATDSLPLSEEDAPEAQLSARRTTRGSLEDNRLQDASSSGSIPGDGFSLTATLRLHGKVPFGSHLKIAGRRIPTGRDGAFALECDLSDGRLAIPFTVMPPSGSGLPKEGLITLDIQRRASYPIWDVLRVIPPEAS
ncbi:MAG: DUF4912 domain-containing protein [Planctomycetota bacterium]